MVLHMYNFANQFLFISLNNKLASRLILSGDSVLRHLTAPQLLMSNPTAATLRRSLQQAHISQQWGTWPVPGV